MNTPSEIHRFRPEYGTTAMTVTKDSGHEPEITAEQAAEQQRARDWVMARHKLIDGMIHNNQMQLKNECARGGAEIERECALRDAARAGAGAEAQAELERVTARLQALQAEHQRLVAEREWLNASLLEFGSGPLATERQRSGNA
jgi:hypothetical protein